ncbi:O-antigen ligase family protein [Rhizobium tumorigenes]|uniref:O-antigen ligase family protein n=1 Tax=Rhizobium tumorigenes TaxID=2041385 RepID=A0AAF1KTW9_9HYPH|nr:O-antigen ligase family protein [Rhizobium tumorigenes]WFR97750.1 O-antigen ligase family protein [Rhizobium tumorigenes]
MFGNMELRSKVTAPSIIQALYVLSLTLAVLPLGAVHSIPLSLATIFSCFLALVATKVFGLPVRTRWLFTAGLILATTTTVWVEIQSMTTITGGFANPLWQDLDKAFLRITGAISIQPADSIATLMFMAVPMMTFLTGLIINRSDEDGRHMAAALTVGGGLCAIYGLIQFNFFPNTNMFFPKVAYQDSLTATFVNRNTAGTFLGLVCLALVRYGWSLSRKISWMALLHPAPSGHIRRSSLLPFFSFIALLFACSVAALLLTKSRGAIASAAIGTLFLVFFLAIQPMKKTGFSAPASRMKRVLRGALAMTIVVGLLVVFGGRTLLRAETQGTDDARFCVLPGILEMAKGEPLLGYGFGTFRYAFPPYRDARCGIVYIWERAHNFYLEGFIGLGVMFVALVFIGLSALLIVHVIGMYKRRTMRSYSALGFASILLVSLHGLVDFSLEIPGMASYFAAIIATTSSVSLGRSPHRGERQIRS